MGYHEDFEWDEAKAESNHRKHKVTFHDAARVLLDDRGDLSHLDEYDEEHSLREDRTLTIARAPGPPGCRPDNRVDRSGRGRGPGHSHPQRPAGHGRGDQAL